jgi:hypothetical protein
MISVIAIATRHRAEQFRFGLSTGHESNYSGMPHGVRFADLAAFFPFVNAGPRIMGKTVPGRIVIRFDRCAVANEREHAT